MANAAGNVANEDVFSQGTEPGASTISMLVTADSYEDIAQYLDGEISESDLKNFKILRPKHVDPGGNLTQNSSQSDQVERDQDEDADQESSDMTLKNPGLSVDDSDDDIDQIVDTEDASPEDLRESEDITTVNKRLSALSVDDDTHSLMAKSMESADAFKEGEDVMVTSIESCPELEYVHSTQWKNHDKHVFMLSRAGKPIYSRYGDEDRLVTLMGVMQAIISFIQSHKDNLRYVVAGEHKFVFLVREHLILVAIARTMESYTHLLLQLTYVYNQVLSILTQSQLNRIFSQLHNYDLRRLLSGTDKLFDNLLNVMNHDPSFFLGAVRCLPLEASVRDIVAQSIAQNAKVKDLVFGILITNNQLITLVRMKRYFLHPLDLHLVFNLVSASESFKTAESWTPICLPKFDANGYLHAYISYLDEACQTCLLLFTVDKDLFFTLADCKKKILEKLNKHNCLKSISDSIKKGAFSISQTSIPELRHFLYKSRSTAQFTSPKFEAPYTNEEDKERVFRLYQYLHHRIHSTSRPLKILFHVGPHETLLGWVTSGFELYAVFGPLVTKPVAINSINKLLKWIKKEEDRLFILNSPTF